MPDDMPRGFDYWGPFWCMILTILTVFAIPWLGVWAWIPLGVIGIFATTMAIVRRKM